MKENAIKFLYAIDCYLLYLLSGVAAAAGVVAYYSVIAAMSFGSIGNTADSSAFAEYVADFVSGKSSVVLLVSYCIVIAAMLLVFAIRRRSLAAYTGMSHARFFSIVGAVASGGALNLITYSFTPASAAGTESINAVLILCVLLGPFVEELMFRGVLLKMFGGACGIVAASLITSVLFAISHTEPVQMLYSFILGVILCVVRVKSTSLWSAIFLHLSFNITGAAAMVYGPVLANGELIMLSAAGVAFLVIACTGGRRRVRKKA